MNKKYKIIIGVVVAVVVVALVVFFVFGKGGDEQNGGAYGDQSQGQGQVGGQIPGGSDVNASGTPGMMPSGTAPSGTPANLPSGTMPQRGGGRGSSTAPQQ